MRKSKFSLLCLFLIFSVVFSSSVAAQSQRVWTLRECIDHALEHNIQLKQQELNRKQQEIQLSTSRNARLPHVDGSMSQNFSFGRGLTSENTYTDTNTSSTSLSVGANVPIFTGFQIPNTIALNKLNLAAATADLEKARNDIRLSVAQAYMECLYDNEIVAVARRQVDIDSMQLARVRSLLQNGKVAPVDVSQVEATLAQSRLTAVQAENNRRLALLTLSQLLELPSPENFGVFVPDVSGLSTDMAVLSSPEEIFALAEQVKPEITADRLRLEGAAKNIDLARSGYYPQLSLSAGLGSNYYKTSGFPAASFGRQLDNNFSQYIGLNLSIPIFDRLTTRNQIRSAKVSHTLQELQLDNTRKALFKEIQQAYYNAVNAREKFLSCRQAEQSAKDAFTLMKAKYENGRANNTEFNESKNSWMRAQSDLAQAQFEYLYAVKLLDFYKGEELGDFH